MAVSHRHRRRSTGSSAVRETSHHNKTKHAMKTSVRQLTHMLLPCVLLLAATSRSSARDIAVQGLGTEVLFTSINPAPTAADTITITQGGTLRVNADGVIGQITIGDANTAGSVVFDHTQRILTVA